MRTEKRVWSKHRRRRVLNALVRHEYYGRFAEKTGKSYEEFTVSNKLQEANDFIMRYLAQQYDIKPPFIFMLGKTHISGALSRQRDIPLKDGDTFKLLPFISGG